MAAHWRWYTSLDVVNGYFHLGVCYLLQQLFAFEVLGQAYNYDRLPQGWNFSGGLFQSRMVQALAGTKAVVYLDDLLIGGATLQEHELNLWNLLSRLEKVGFHVNKSKIVLCINNASLSWDTT